MACVSVDSKTGVVLVCVGGCCCRDQRLGCCCGWTVCGAAVFTVMGQNSGRAYLLLFPFAGRVSHLFLVCVDWTERERLDRLCRDKLCSV